MAGVQFICRKFLLSNSSRFVNKSKIFLQPCREKHHFIFQMSSVKRQLFFKSKLMAINGKPFTYRFSSTDSSVVKEEILTAVATNVTDSQNKQDESSTQSGVSETSSENVSFDDSVLPPIPSATTPDVTEIPVMDFVSMGLKEPSFQSLGLGSWWPSGLVQQVMEFLHISLGLPWWEAILIVTTVVRIGLLPLNIQSKKCSIKMNNQLPEIHKIQENINVAKIKGDYFEVASETQKLQELLQKNGITMVASLKPMLFQTPVFLSMFYAFRGMCNAPVESMKEGGLFWFTDLTAADPYYILPIILSCSQLAMIEFGAEGTSLHPGASKMKWFMRGVPIIVLIVATRFSACMTYYWAVSNLLALLFLQLWSVSFFRRLVGLPELVKRDLTEYKKSKKGFIENFKEGFSNAKLISEIQDRERMNQVAFERAGSAPVPRTFKNNPLAAKGKKAL